MTTDSFVRNIENSSITDRLEYLVGAMGSKRFLKKEGLGNEVPFFICPYDQKESKNFNSAISSVANRLEKESGVKVLTVNLYDLSIELLQEREIFNQIMEVEQTISKDELKELLQGVLDTEQHLVPAIAKKMKEHPFDILFLTGVAEVFPFIRSHNVLNNLQSTAKEQPTVMFFPGKYNHSLEVGASLDLFNKLEDDKYYRAFNIYSFGWEGN